MDIINTEEIYQKSIQEQIYRLPVEYENYAKHLLEEENKTYYEAHKELTVIEAYYNILSMKLNKIAFKITPRDLENASTIADTFVKKRLTKTETVSLADFYQWLFKEQLVIYPIVEYPPTENDLQIQRKHHKPKKIKSPSEVAFFKDDIKKYTQITVDHKYSLEKNFLGSYTNYTYMIHDNEAGKYFLDENGEILEIKQYKSAREFIKNYIANTLKIYCTI